MESTSSAEFEGIPGEHINAFYETDNHVFTRVSPSLLLLLVLCFAFCFSVLGRPGAVLSFFPLVSMSHSRCFGSESSSFRRFSLCLSTLSLSCMHSVLASVCLCLFVCGCIVCPGVCGGEESVWFRSVWQRMNLLNVLL